MHNVILVCIYQGPVVQSSVTLTRVSQSKFKIYFVSSDSDCFCFIKNCVLTEISEMLPKTRNKSLLSSRLSEKSFQQLFPIIIQKIITTLRTKYKRK